MLSRILRSEKGSALITGVIVMMLVSMLGLAYVSLSSTNLIRASRDERHATAFYLAEAAIEYKIADIIPTCETNGGHVPTANFDSTSLLNGLVASSSGTVTITPDSGNDAYATIVSTANYRGITETVRVRMRIKDVSIWNNAIFAGIGQSGRGINGNVDIRGSVHILGDGDPFTDMNGNGIRDMAEAYTDSNGNGQYDSGEPFVDSDGNGLYSPTEPFQDNNMNGSYDPPLTATELATDMSGSANIGNNYNGMPAVLSAKIPPLVPTDIGGESVYTLNSEVRIKHGKMNLSGTALAGAANVTGNLVKETLDGMYVTDGYGGNKGATNVQSDNDTVNGYDLGDRLRFPGLLDAYTDPSTGVSYSTYEAYLDSRSLVVPVSKIDATVPNFTYSDGANSISWNQMTRTMTVSGIVRFAGDLDLGTKDFPIYYSGRGTLFCKNDVKTHGSVMPSTVFPTTDVLGVIAKRDIFFATGTGEAQLYSAGAWYAQRKIVSAKQNQFAGTYVADYFDMGTNVPSIYQVPALSSNLPPGMPGGDVHIVVAQVNSWRRIVLASN